MINEAAIMERADKGLLRRQWHPSGKLQIINYTERCAYEGAWDEVTRACRGLILDQAFEVVARPFPKFFNVGELHAPVLKLDAPVKVTDKLDGSLGILYPEPEGGWAIATRGSFTSDQAKHATQVWEERYIDWVPGWGATYLFEIIYPTNRIVVDYEGMDDLVLLGCNGPDGNWYGPESFPDWKGPAAETLPYSTFKEALEAPTRPGREGFVVYFVENDERVKIKEEEYVTLHRLVFGLTKRRIWEHLGVLALHEEGMDAKRIGRTLRLDVTELETIIEVGERWQEELKLVVPEEFWAWIEGCIAEIGSDVIYWVDAAEDTMNEIRSIVDHDADRGVYAREIAKYDPDLKAALFDLLDGKPVTSHAWRSVRPEHDTYKPVEEGM